MKLAAAAAKLLQGLVCLLLLATLAVPVARAQEQAQPAAAAAPSFDEIKAALDEAEAAIDDDAVGADKLADLRQKINDLASSSATSSPRSSRAPARSPNGSSSSVRRRRRTRRRKRGHRQRAQGSHQRRQRARRRRQAGAAPPAARRPVERARLGETALALCPRAVRAHAEHPRSAFLARCEQCAAGRVAPTRRHDRLLAGNDAGPCQRLPSHRRRFGPRRVLLVIYFVGRWIRPKADTPRDAAPRAWQALRVFTGGAMRPCWRRWRHSRSRAASGS